MGKEGAAYCEDCNSVFPYEEREKFVAESVFCPSCSGRCPELFATLTAAEKKHSKAKVLRSTRSSNPL